MADDEPIDPMVTIHLFPSERTAQESARTLVEHGVGSEIEPAVPPGVDAAAAADRQDGPPPRNTDEYSAMFGLRVMRHQVETACAALGLDLPAETVSELEEKAKAPKPTPWRRILVIWAIAMIVIPLVAGYLTYLIVQR